ncbi:MAG: SufD family Fe-S cluster assembly protein [Chlamydiota bacterium]
MTSLASFQQSALDLLERQHKSPHFKKALSKYPVTGEGLPHVDYTARKNELLFVDGHFAPHLSCEIAAKEEELLVFPLEEAYPLYTPLIDLHMQVALQQTSPFALFAVGAAKTPLLLHIEEGENVEIDLVYLQTRSHLFSPICLQVYLEKEARCSVTTRIVSKEKNLEGCLSQHISVSLEKQSTLSWCDQMTYNGVGGTIASAFYGSLQGGAQLRKTSIHAQAERSEEHVHLTLFGKEAHAAVSSLLLPQGAMRAHLAVTAEHAHPEARSSQQIKTLGADASKTHFSGKIYVHAEAQKTEAYQQHQSLLLSEEASVCSEPNLEIFADDVKASHGATIASFEEEALFYLQSRGMSLGQAKSLLAKAFCREVLDAFPKRLQTPWQGFVEKFVGSHAHSND